MRVKFTDQKGKIFNLIGVVVLFGLLTFIMIYPFMRVHQMAIASDWEFHANRVEQIYQNLRQGQPFTFIGTSYFGGVGTGSFLFYPSIFLYPWAILRFYLAPVEAYYVFVGTIFFMTFIISFFCMKKFSTSNTRSFVFSLVYGIAPYHLYLGLTNYVLGEFIAYTFIPIVFLAFYKILFSNSKSWKMLSASMALVFYAHLVSIFIIIEFFILILLAYTILKKNIEKSKILVFFKAAIMTLLLVLPVLVPFLTDFIGQNVSSTATGLFSVDTKTLLLQTLNNGATNEGGIGIILLITILIGWQWVKNNDVEKNVYFLGIFSVIIISSLLPWFLLKGTLFSAMQFTFRYSTYAILFLAVTISFVIDETLKSCSYQNVISTNTKNVVSVFFIFIIGIGIYLGSISSDIIRNSNLQQSSYLKKDASNELVKISDPVIINNDSYENQFDYLVVYGETDYYPQIAQKYALDILSHNAIVNGKKKKLIPVSSPNKLTFKFNLGQNAKVDLPVLMYKHTFTKVNGRLATISASQRGTVQLKLKAGQNKIDVSYRPSKLFHYSIVICLLVWIFIFVNTLIVRLKTRCEDNNYTNLK